LRAAEAGVNELLATHDSGCNQVVAPHGSDEGRLATNPIAVGVPRQTRPHLVLDMATSVVSHGTVELARRNHAAVPSEWTGSSPDVLRPLGGPKGTGLALLVDVLAGILSGAGFSGSEAEHDYQGVWLLALDPAWFEGGQDLAADVDVLVAHVRSARPDGSGGYGDVLVPGEPGARATRANLDRGVPIDEHVWADVLELAESLGVPPITPFEEAEP
jgi:LDH2 family malate/lactate/ureidoglycolate dehydrogenase